MSFFMQNASELPEGLQHAVRCTHLSGGILARGPLNAGTLCLLQDRLLLIHHVVGFGLHDNGFKVEQATMP